MTDNQTQTVYQSEPVKSDEIYANVLQEERVRNIIAQTSPDNQLTDIEWRIRGYKKNPYTNQWEKININVAEPNPILISKYIAFLSSILNDNTRFTNLSGNDINRIMKLVIEWVSDDLDTNSEEYGLTGHYTEMTRIGHIILAQTFIVLKRSQDGSEARRIWNALNVNESLNPMQQQKKGFFGFLKDLAK